MQEKPPVYSYSRFVGPAAKHFRVASSGVSGIVGLLARHKGLTFEQVNEQQHNPWGPSYSKLEYEAAKEVITVVDALNKRNGHAVA